MQKRNNKQQKNLNDYAMAIGWASNAPWAATGYGQQTNQVISRLVRDSHEVAVYANYGLEGTEQTFQSAYGSVKIYPRGGDLYSNDVTPAHHFDHTSQNSGMPEALITLYDVWVYKGQKWADWNVASWVPIDHMPAPPAVVKWCAQDFVTPLAMSRYGQAMLNNAEVEALYVPHAIEKTFKPTDMFRAAAGQMLTGRELMGIADDRFVVGMNSANKGIMPNRKAFGENLLAFSMFANNHRDAVLYLHTDPFGALGGIKLIELVRAVGIRDDQIVFADPYSYRAGLSTEALAALYSSMNVLLATSYGEGFGVPTIEAQACGTPVIVSDFAASTELVGDGWLIEGQPLWDAPQSSFFNIPSVPQIVEALEAAYARSGERSQKAVEFAANFDADKVFNDYWRPALRILHDKSLERL